MYSKIGYKYLRIYSLFFDHINNFFKRQHLWNISNPYILRQKTWVWIQLLSLFACYHRFQGRKSRMRIIHQDRRPIETALCCDPFYTRAHASC